MSFLFNAIILSVIFYTRIICSLLHYLFQRTLTKENLKKNKYFQVHFWHNNEGLKERKKTKIWSISLIKLKNLIF